MGQKTHPKLFRVGVIESWDSKWYARHDYAKLLHEDLKVKKFLKQRLYHAGISRIDIERAASKAKINIHTARPGIVIGKNSRIARSISTSSRCAGLTSTRSSFLKTWLSS
uniref:Small ribosomal subunit protein uS3 n=1 Tax=uncultured delta proteobacterium Rifle_16ft_4_minimus_31151 TaxID=1665179 RepID=A0A0H4TBM8_9DELT|nr:30S ribosomal protein S3, small subunit ribosomal protein S3 [uncultured delta proteobacterium Rifle_16ft_4_minimus_31151]